MPTKGSAEPHDSQKEKNIIQRSSTITRVTFYRVISWIKITSVNSTTLSAATMGPMEKISSEIGVESLIQKVVKVEKWTWDPME